MKNEIPGWMTEEELAIFDKIADGTLPVPQTTHFPLSEGATAIRLMGAAGHTGKLVLDIPHTGEYEVALGADQAPVYRADGSYIVTGGLSGLGLFLAGKMADGGCGRAGRL